MRSSPHLTMARLGNTAEAVDRIAQPTIKLNTRCHSFKQSRAETQMRAWRRQIQ